MLSSRDSWSAAALCEVPQGIVTLPSRRGPHRGTLPHPHSTLKLLAFNFSTQNKCGHFKPRKAISTLILQPFMLTIIMLAKLLGSEKVLPGNRFTSTGSLGGKLSLILEIQTSSSEEGPFPLCMVGRSFHSLPSPLISSWTYFL